MGSETTVLYLLSSCNETGLESRNIDTSLTLLYSPTSYHNQCYRTQADKSVDEPYGSRKVGLEQNHRRDRAASAPLVLLSLVSGGFSAGICREQAQPGNGLRWTIFLAGNAQIRLHLSPSSSTSSLRTLYAHQLTHAERSAIQLT